MSATAMRQTLGGSGTRMMVACYPKSALPLFQSGRSELHAAQRRDGCVCVRRFVKGDTNPIWRSRQVAEAGRTHGIDCKQGVRQSREPIPHRDARDASAGDTEIRVRTNERSI